jgi:hypothetical protein
MLIVFGFDANLAAVHYVADAHNVADVHYVAVNQWVY